jgi:hypothetical protein
MPRFRRFLLFAGVLIGSLMWAQNPPTPRAAAKDYPSSKAESQYSIGAKMLTKTQVQNSFATPLAGRYVVVEVGFYPADGKTLDLQTTGFSLHTSDGKDFVTPATPEQIASILQRRPQGGRDVTLYPQANVGYESYPVYNPNGSVTRAGGPVYGAGLGVGLGQSPAVANTDSDRRTMETELRDKELKGGDISKPVAGYLYFPVSSKDKVTYELRYSGPDGISSLPLNEK